MKAEDPAKKGVCSNWICDAKPGDEIQLTGPTGKVRAEPADASVFSFFFLRVYFLFF